MTSLCLPVDEGLISIYLQCAYVTLLQHPFLKQHREGARLQGFLFQICYEYKVHRLNNILIIGNPRDTDIRQCIHNQLIKLKDTFFDTAVGLRANFARMCG